jgi:predicted  nucleic acid-binding Zn-ribbon protein
VSLDWLLGAPAVEIPVGGELDNLQKEISDLRVAYLVAEKRIVELSNEVSALEKRNADLFSQIDSDSVRSAG